MTLADIPGQDRALRILGSLLERGRLPPALLFSGPKGAGKSAAAADFARALNASSPASGPDVDVTRVDGAFQAGLLGEDEAKQSSIKVDTIRRAIQGLEMSSFSGRWKTAIVEDAHLLVQEAANAMLKALEEPPPRTLWILVTHRPELLLGTVRSRCQAVGFAPPAPEAMRALALKDNPAPEPSAWLGDPLAPIRLAEELPRELHLSRPIVEGHLSRMAWHVRSRDGEACYGSSSARSVLRDLTRLRRALSSNADPRLVLELAALSLERLEAAAAR